MIRKKGYNEVGGCRGRGKIVRPLSPSIPGVPDRTHAPIITEPCSKGNGYRGTLSVPRDCLLAIEFALLVVVQIEHLCVLQEALFTHGVVSDCGVACEVGGQCGHLFTPWLIAWCVSII